MMRIEFTVEDIARVSFLPEPAPLLELKLALVTLHRRDPAPRLGQWRRATLARFPASARPVWDLVAGFSGSMSTTAVCGDFDEAMETAQHLTRAQANREARIWFGGNERVAPSWLRAAADGDRDGGQRLFRGLSSGYVSVLRPYWPAIRAGHHTELARHGRLLARHGAVGVLTNLVAGARWRDTCLEIDTPHRQEIRLQGQGLTLAPTAFWPRPLLLAGTPDQPVMLVYPSTSPARLQLEPDHDPLAGVLGPTRAAVLRLVGRPAVTKDIAHELGISRASASEHAAALRAAHLIVSRRDGKAVVHHVTPLGFDLINANSR
jgi:DNA-binding transcriptional ArsR family regulator